MDQLSQDTLAEILKLDKSSLSEDQKGFLLARRSYLNDSDRARYQDLIDAHEDGLKEGAKEKKEKKEGK